MFCFLVAKKNKISFRGGGGGGPPELKHVSFYFLFLILHLPLKGTFFHVPPPLYGALEFGRIQTSFDFNLLLILFPCYLYCLNSHRLLYPPTFTFTILPIFVGGQEGRTFVLPYILAVLLLLLQRREGHALGQGSN